MADGGRSVFLPQHNLPTDLRLTYYSLRWTRVSPNLIACELFLLDEFQGKIVHAVLRRFTHRCLAATLLGKHTRQAGIRVDWQVFKSLTIHAARVNLRFRGMLVRILDRSLTAHCTPHEKFGKFSIAFPTSSG